MSIFDFIFGKKKKKEQERLLLEQEAQLKLEQERQERERRLEESRRQEKAKQKRQKAERQNSESMRTFTFKSNCHQRYENNVPVRGLQETKRTVSVVKNTNGCAGYKLEPGLGYIVKIYNDELGKPNMSDKPMKIVRKTTDMVELRGYPIEARSPFGWQEVDYSDYGFVVYYKNGQIEKCVLHMYDRNTYIEYRKVAKVSGASSNVPRNIKAILDAATIGLAAAQQGNRRLEQENLISLFNLTQDKSSQLLQIPADKYNWLVLSSLFFWNIHRYVPMKIYHVLSPTMHSSVFPRP